MGEGLTLSRLIAVLSFCSLKVNVCASVSGVGIPSSVGEQSFPRCPLPSQWNLTPKYWILGSASSGLTGFNTSVLLRTDVEAVLQLDWLKGARGGVKRVLFLDTQEPQRTMLLRLGHRHPRVCLTHTIYLKVSTRQQSRRKLHEKEMQCFIFCSAVRRTMSSGTN